MYNDELIRKLVHIESVIYNIKESKDLSRIESLFKDVAYSAVALKRFCFATSIDELLNYLREHDDLETDQMLYPYEYYIWVGCKGNNTMRAIPDYQIFYCYNGQVTVMFPDATLELNAGDVMLLNRDVVMRVDTQSEDDILITTIVTTNYIRDFLINSPFEQLLPPIFGQYAPEETRYQIFHQNGNERLRYLFSALVREYADKKDLADEAIMSYVDLIFVELFREDTGYTYRRMPMDANRLGEVIGAINSDPASITLEKIGQMVYFSPNYISSALKKATGQSFKQMVHSARLSKAADMLLNTNIAIADVSVMVGYKNVSYFYKLFHEAYGISPGEYRNRREEKTDA